MPTGESLLSLEVSIAFFGVAVLLALLPGPDNLFVLMHSVLHGRRAGGWVVLGLCTGLLVHTSLVACGVGAFFDTDTVAFTGLKALGACYLLYLAKQAFYVSGTVDAGEPELKLSSAALYLRGIVMNLTNPKVLIFFLAFLPQFTEPSEGLLWMQLLYLGVLFIFATVVVFGMLVILAGTLGSRFMRSTSVQKLMNRVAGVVFIALAFRLALKNG